MSSTPNQVHPKESISAKRRGNCVNSCFKSDKSNKVQENEQKELLPLTHVKALQGQKDKYQGSDISELPGVESDDHPLDYKEIVRKETSLDDKGRIKLTSDGNLFDPASNLDYLNQVKEDSDINMTTISPFDLSKYCQVMKNPKTTGQDFEVITVQKICENVQMYDPNGPEPKKESLYMQCDDPNHRLSLCKRDDKFAADDAENQQVCMVCNESKRKDQIYECSKCNEQYEKRKEEEKQETNNIAFMWEAPNMEEQKLGTSIVQQFYVCVQCQVQHLKERKIAQKTDKHHFYEEHSLLARKYLVNSQDLNPGELKKRWESSSKYYLKDPQKYAEVSIQSKKQKVQKVLSQFDQNLKIRTDAPGKLTKDKSQYYSAIAFTEHGSIPGKEKDGTCWYSYDGRQCTTENCRKIDKYVISSKQDNLSTSFLKNDGDNEYYCALAITDVGTIPGKAKNGKCWYLNEGREIETQDFFYILYDDAILEFAANDSKKQVFGSNTKSTKINKTREYAIIGLWKISDSGEYECYNNFIINQPKFFKSWQNPTILSGFNNYRQWKNDQICFETLLLVGEQGQIFFFQNEDEKDQSPIRYCEIDLEKAMVKQNTFRDQSQIPDKKSINLTDVPLEILRWCLGEDQNESHVLYMLPKQVDNKLCFSCPPIIFDDNGIFKELDKSKDPKRNLMFVDLDEPSKIDRMIEDMFVLIGLDQDNNKQIIWCVNKLYFAKVVWKENIGFPNMIQSAQDIGQYMQVPADQQFKYQDSFKLEPETWQTIIQTNTPRIALYTKGICVIFDIDESQKLANKIKTFDNPYMNFDKVEVEHKSKKVFMVFSCQNYSNKYLKFFDIDQVTSNSSFGDLPKMNIFGEDQFHKITNHSIFGSFYFFDPVYNEEEDAENNKPLHWQFRTQYVYYDATQDKYCVEFVRGRTNERDSQYKYLRNSVNLPQQSHDTHFQVNWPLLMHNTASPKQNELMVCNLLHNAPKKLVNLGDIRFICFVDTGFTKIHKTDGKNYFMFLAALPGSNQLRLMIYDIYPWPIDLANCKIHNKNDNLLIVHGEINFKRIAEKCWFKNIASQTQAYRKDYIVKACYVKRGKLAIQFPGQIMVFDMSQPQSIPKVFCSDQIQQEIEQNFSAYMGSSRNNVEEMINIKMISATNNYVYYIKYDNAGYHLMAISFYDHEVKEKSIYTSSDFIIAIKLATDQDQNQNQHSIYLQTVSSMILFKFIGDNSNSGPEFQKEHEIKRYFGYNDDKWLQYGLSFRQVIKQQDDQFSFHSHHQDNVFYLRTKFMANQRNLQQNDSTLDTDEKLSTYYTRKYKPDGLEQLQGIGQVIFVAREHDMPHFMVKQSLDYRTVHLSNYQDERKQCQSLTFVGDKILMTIDGQQMLFNQTDLMLHETIAHPHFEQETRKSLNNEASTQCKSQNNANQQSKNDNSKNDLSLQYFEIQGMDIEKMIRVKYFAKYNPKTHKFYRFQNDIKKYLKDVFNELQKIQIKEKKNNSQFLLRSNSILKHGLWIVNENDIRFVFIAKLESQKEMVNQPELSNEKKKTQIIQTKLRLTKDNKLVATRPEKNQKLFEDKFITTYIILSNEFQENKDKIDYLISDKYLIIKDRHEILYTELAKVETNNKNISKTFYSKDIKDDQILDTQFIEKMVQKPKYGIQLKKVGLVKLLTDTQRYDYKVSLISKSQATFYQYKDQQESTNNELLLIQFENKRREITLIWDLELNNQVKEVINSSQFGSAELFVSQGIPTRVYSTNQTFKTIEENNEKSLYLIPRIVNQGPRLFRPNTYIDYEQIISLQKSLTNNQKPSSIDLDIVFCQFYGRNFFDTFQDNPKVLNHVQEWFESQRSQLQSQEPFKSENLLQIREHETQRQVFTTKRTNDMFLRRLNATLQQPLIKHVRDPFKQEHGKNNKGTKHKEQENQESTLHIHQIQESKLRITKQDKSFIHYLMSNQTSKEFFETLQILFEFIGKFKQFQLSDLIRDTDDFSECFKAKLSFIDDFLDNAFIDNEITTVVKKVKANTRKKILYFNSNTSWLREEQIEERITNKLAQKSCSTIVKEFLLQKNKSDQYTSKETKVSVRIIDMGWYNNNQQKFYECLLDQELNIMNNDLAKNVVKSQDYSQIIIRQILPYWAAYALSSIIYLSIYIVDVKDDTIHEVTFENTLQGNVDLTLLSIRALLMLTMLLLTIHNLAKEYKEIAQHHLVYFTKYSNYPQFFICNSNFFLIVGELLKFFYYDVFGQTVMVYFATITVMMIWLNFFYWARLSQRLQLYVELILMTFADIRQFIYLFLIMIMLFANGFYILDSSKEPYKYEFTDSGPDLTGCLPSGGKIVKDIDFSTPFVNTIYYSYLISLGENYAENFEETAYPFLAWAVLLFATMFLQIVFLNMIIAIMGDTFDKVYDQRDRYSLGVCPEIYSDYFSSLQLGEEFKGQKFLYVVEFLENQRVTEWEGSIHQMKDTVQRAVSEIESKLVSKNDDLMASNLKLEKNMRAIQEENSVLQTSVKKLDNSNTQIQKGNDQLRKDMQEIQDKNDMLVNSIKKLEKGNQEIQDTLKSLLVNLAKNQI